MNTETKILMSVAEIEYDGADFSPMEVTAKSVRSYFHEFTGYKDAEYVALLGKENNNPNFLLMWAIMKEPLLSAKVDWEMVAKQARQVVKQDDLPEPTLEQRVKDYLAKQGKNRTVRAMTTEFKMYDNSITASQVKAVLDTLVAREVVYVMGDQFILQRDD